MKVVMCQNCGAKYQLDDTDDIKAFECSVCAGSLEEIESFPDNQDSEFFDYDIYDVDPNSVLVYCKDCGLKYQLDKDDDISEFECTSCGGQLDYVTDSTQFIESEDVPYDNRFQSEEGFAEEEIPAEEELFNYENEDIIPIHAENNSDSSYSDDGDIVPIHMEENYNEEPQSHEVETYFEDVFTPEVKDYYDYSPFEAEYDSNEDIIPIHVENNVSSYSEAEIIPIHAEGNNDSFPVSEEYASLEDSGSNQEDYIYNINAEDIIPIHAEQQFAEVDKIIPIHAENRRKENNSPNVTAGFKYNNFANNQAQVVEEKPIVQDVNSNKIPTLNRKIISEGDEAKYETGKNKTVDNKGEYEAYKLAKLKYYAAIMDILKDEYLRRFDDEFYKGKSVRRLIKKGNDGLKNINLNDDSRNLVTPEMTQAMEASRDSYEPKRSTSADVLIIAGLFLSLVGITYYISIQRLIHVLSGVAAGIIILMVGLYLRYRFKDYVTRGRIIREKLLTLPPMFHVFYAVHPPGSKDIINHVVVGPTGVFTIISKRYDPGEYKDRIKSDKEIDGMINDSASIQDYMDEKNTLELQDGYDDNQTRFQFGNEEIHFAHNSRVKRKALGLNEDLAIFLDKKGLSGIYIEPLLGFINNDLAILNVILTNEDMFMDELFHKMIYGQRRLDEMTIETIALLLSHYSANCSE